MRVAVIGLGRMGRRHVQVVRGLGMEVVGLCDQLQECIDITCTENGLDSAICYRNADDMLPNIRAEALVVATTAPSHAELVCKAAQLGSRYILCEKPIATSIAQARSIIEHCESHDVRLAVNHQMQFMPQYTEIKSAVDTAEMGRLVSILVAGSNFGLAMNGSHYFEMFRFLTGGTVQTVEAWLDETRVPNPRGAQFEDRAGKIRVTGAGGVSMYLDCSAAAGHGLNVMYTCRLGQIFVDELSGFVRVSRRKDEYRELPATRYGMPAVEEIRQVQPADVIAPTRSVWEAMLADREYPDGWAGLHAVTCLAAAHTSHELGGLCLRTDDPRIDDGRVYPWA